MSTFPNPSLIHVLVTWLCGNSLQEVESFSPFLGSRLVWWFVLANRTWQKWHWVSSKPKPKGSYAFILTVLGLNPLGLAWRMTRDTWRRAHCPSQEHHGPAYVLLPGNAWENPAKISRADHQSWAWRDQKTCLANSWTINNYFKHCIWRHFIMQQ